MYVFNLHIILFPDNDEWQLQRSSYKSLYEYRKISQKKTAWTVPATLRSFCERSCVDNTFVWGCRQWTTTPSILGTWDPDIPMVKRSCWNTNFDSIWGVGYIIVYETHYKTRQKLVINIIIQYKIKFDIFIQCVYSN